MKQNRLLMSLCLKTRIVLFAHPPDHSRGRACVVCRPLRRLPRLAMNRGLCSLCRTGVWSRLRGCHAELLANGVQFPSPCLAIGIPFSHFDCSAAEAVRQEMPDAATAGTGEKA
jgi:hypothetical protein